MAIEYEMPLGMLIRKMYCAGCGARLVRKKIRKTYRRGEEGFRNTLSNRSTINVQSYTAVTYVYRCYNYSARQTFMTKNSNGSFYILESRVQKIVNDLGRVFSTDKADKIDPAGRD
jgi:hypothetical protein